MLGLTTAEQVQRQRFGALADLLKGCGEVVQHQHRQERSEQFLGHQRIIAVIHTNHGGGDAPLLPADFTSDQDAPIRSGGLQQLLQPIELAFIDDLPQLIRVEGIGAIHLRSGLLHRLQQR